MKKITIALLALLLCLSLLPACGKKEYNVDKNELAAALASSGCFLDTVAEIPAELIGMFYQTDSSVSAVMYKSSIATAEEITVLEAASATDAEGVLKIANDYITSQANLYDSYNPTEASRLRGSIVRQYGKYVIVCVCNDNAGAQKIIDEFFK